MFTDNELPWVHLFTGFYVCAKAPKAASCVASAIYTIFWMKAQTSPSGYGTQVKRFDFEFCQAFIHFPHSRCYCSRCSGDYERVHSCKETASRIVMPVTHRIYHVSTICERNITVA